MHLKQVSLPPRHGFDVGAFPNLDSERRIVVPLVRFEVVLRRIAEEVGDDEQGYVWAFRLCPCEQVVKLLGWDAPHVVFAVNEPPFASSALVNIGAVQVSYDVPSTVSRASLLARALTPIEVNKVQLFQQVVGELLEFSVRHFVERQPMLGWFHRWLRSRQF